MRAGTDWPGGRKVVALVTVALELWSPGHWPAYAPMAAAWPMPGVDDTHSTSWAKYGVTTGMRRLLDLLGDLPATVGVNGLVAELHPGTVVAVHEAGHEIAAHSWAQDVVPGMLDADAERTNIRRCTDVLHGVTGVRPTGWMSPRATGSHHTADLLAEAGYRWTGDHCDHDFPQILSTAHGPLVSLMHSDHSDVRDAAAGPYAYRDLHRELLNQALDAPGPGVFRLTVHAHVGGRPLLAGMIGQVLDDLRASDDVWVATHAQVAEHLLAHRGGTR
ncbi:polysaccharide deacetylase family protein [Streptomyces sp. NBC_00083]|uniref:polysaccharide deacetylase family protein n=1 Tax=Streptomyces sp. NBC_00083 TaxID=2975647 RepID=UPI00224F0D74|nr:polysaccharide deacetylase family protein [Streptomyces sp. NBC_00083]MCX5387588.1 polysaccharide deacetylase family protein [Streptomyces sp. NBC_00083]